MKSIYFVILILILLYKDLDESDHIRVRRSGWSADQIAADDDDWEIHWTTPTVKTRPTTTMNTRVDYEINEDAEFRKKLVDPIKTYVIPIVTPSAIILLGVGFYCFCKKGLCSCCKPLDYKKKIQGAVQTYVPGMIVHEDGTTEVYEPTEKEMEKLGNALGELASM